MSPRAVQRWLHARPKVVYSAKVVGCSLLVIGIGTLGRWWWLRDQVRPEYEFNGHEGAVNSIAFDPVTNTVASAGDKMLWTWQLDDPSQWRLTEPRTWVVNVPKGRLLRKGSFEFVDFLPDNRLLVGDKSQGLLIIDRFSGQILQAFHTPYLFNMIVAISPDKRFAAASFNDLRNDPASPRRIEIFAIESLDRAIRRLVGHKDWVSALQFDPSSGDILVSAAFDGTLRVWDLSNGAQIK